MNSITKRICVLLVLCFIATVMGGFTALPPENWEAIDPEFHLQPPDQESSGVIVSPRFENVIIIEPIIPFQPQTEVGPRVILLDRVPHSISLPK